MALGRAPSERRTEAYVVQQAEAGDLYEWLAGGDLKRVDGSAAEIDDMRRKANGLTEVVVWQDGGQSAASVRREEWMG